MARQNLFLGTVANDGTGETLRGAGQKINDNFRELYTLLGDSNGVTTYVQLGDSGVIFNGTSFDTILTAADPSSKMIITLPNSTGTVLTTTSTATITNKTLTSPILTTPQINDTSADHRYIFAVSELVANRTITLPLLSGNDTFVFAAHTQTLTNKTLTSAILTTPRVVTRIDDTNGAELIRVTATASAVNDITIANAATGNSPAITATGDDSNVGLAITSKGTGNIVINKVAFGNTSISSTGNAAATANYVRFTGTTATVTIPNSTVTGDIRIVSHDGASGTLTVAFPSAANFAQGTSIALDANDTVMLIWNNTATEWNIIGGYGYTVS